MVKVDKCSFNHLVAKADMHEKVLTRCCASIIEEQAKILDRVQKVFTVLSASQVQTFSFYWLQLDKYIQAMLIHFCSVDAEVTHNPM